MTKNLNEGNQIHNFGTVSVRTIPVPVPLVKKLRFLRFWFRFRFHNVWSYTSLKYQTINFLLVEKERLQQAGVDPLAGSESPSAKKRQKSKLNYLLRYCPPAVGLPENTQPDILANGGDLTRAAASPGGQSVSPMPALMLSMPPGVNIFNGAEPKSPRAAAALPMIKVKKKHDLYGKNSSKRCTTKATGAMMDNFRPSSSQQLRYATSAVWSSEGRAAAADHQSSLDADEIAEPAANLFPVGRQVKFRIFDWKSAAKSAAADQPNQAAIQPPLLQWLPETRAAPAAATIPLPPFGGYDIVKSEPMEMPPADYHHTAFTRHAEAVNRRMTAERHTAVGDSRPALVESHPTSVDLPRLPADPEIWRQLHMHQFKREVLVDQPSFSYKNSSDLFMPQNLTSSGGSGSCSSDSGGSSTHSSRSNSCQLPNMEDEEEEEEEGCEQPLDFSLPALCAAGVGATGALSAGRKYSAGATGALLSPGRKYSGGSATGALSPGRKYSAGSETVALSPCRKFSMSATEAQNPGRKYCDGATEAPNPGRKYGEGATEAPSPGRKYCDGATEALSPGRKYSVIMNLWNR
jgi:hypothetical protein